ncbi:MAG: glycosyltransferase family 4 protein [Planctomycetes bacterium]|nr:glycosyltransferase family 4 protein [Planctomycetota bacterium]
MKIVYLVDDAVHPWGGVQVVLRQADALHARGHEVTVLCRSAAPTWYEPRCTFVTVDDFDATDRSGGIVVGTWCRTVPSTLGVSNAIPVHFCQGYEGDDPQHEDHLWTIERIYRLPTHKIVISEFLARRIASLFGDRDLTVVPYGIRDDLFGRKPHDDRAPQRTRGCGPLRVGLIGPYDVSWKDIPTGIDALRIASRERDIEVVRVSPTPITDRERATWEDLRVEEHTTLDLERMASIYRSLDVFLGTSNGGAEGFFLPAVEAMASGVPCILTDIECFHTHGTDDDRHRADHAIFVRAGDAKAMARAIIALAADAPRWSRLAERGLEVASHHTFSKHVDAIESVFSKLFVERAMTDGAVTGSTSERGAMCHRMIDSSLITRRKSGAHAAVSIARAACALTPDSADAWLCLARILAETQVRVAADGKAEPSDLGEARCAFERARALCHDTPEIAWFEGRLAHAEGNVSEAARCYERAIGLGHPGLRLRSELANLETCIC